MESLKELEINKESEKEDIVIKIRECSNVDPKYKLALNREKSFEGCPKPFAPYVSVLAEAGFFYHQDYSIRCFSCSGNIALDRHDKESMQRLFEDPWINHAFLFPHCDLVEQVKGNPYILRALHRGYRLKGVMTQDYVLPRPIQSTMQCHVCMQKELQVVFVPCGHVCACGGCASGLDKCAVCRRDILYKQRMYLC
uniref:Inhibitor of apoptosis n=1 Tax=Crassostrea virginica TaxID=6565 RepID=A0A8B8E6M4_CRAVI|nr:putative inhibitor of apoptosis [Crassostrea virginica]